MKKPAEWDKVSAITGEYQALPAGGYVCKVVSVFLTNSKAGKEMIVLGLDIADGEFKDYFHKQYAARYAKDNNAKWGCMYYQLTEGESMGRFKGMLQNFEDSNNGYQWTWGDDCEQSLKGKFIGGKFGEEEYIGTDNKVHTAVKCVQLLPVEGITEIDAPAKKTLPNNNPSGSAAGTSWGIEMPSNNEIIPF